MFRIATLVLVLGLSFASTGYAASASKAFTLSNTGDGALAISGAAISGNTAEFTLTGNTCASVAPGASCALTVTFTPTGSDTRAGASLNFSSNGTNGPTHSISLLGTGAPSEIVHVISANATDVNMASLFGNPATPGTYVLTINSGVQVTASSTSVAALSTGTFPAGSTVRIVNNGYVLGKGGGGGCGAGSCGAAASPGSSGGPALRLDVAVSLDNGSGLIGGGGGGGGGGGRQVNRCSVCSGGGGGGAGSGPGGAGYAYGAAGTALAGGSGGPAGANGSPGGAGGSLGVAGAPGGGYAVPGGAGGAAGLAVATNGHGLTWLGGNDATHVKGAVQ